MNQQKEQNKELPNYVLLVEESGETKHVILEKSLYTIGRKKTNSIVVESSQASRIHATIRKIMIGERPTFVIQDGDVDGNPSFNGILVDNQRVKSHELKHGDVVRIGMEVVLTFYVSYDLNEVLQNGSDSRDLFSFEDDDEINSTIGEGLDDEFDDNLKQIKNNNSSAYISNFKTTVVEQADEEFLKLSSILELCPNPILEINYEGNITYCNPSTHIIFQDLEKLNNKHPIFVDILENRTKYKGEILKREIKVKQDIYEQYVHYLPDQDLIRFYIFNITKRKRLEKNLKYNAFYDYLTDLPNRRSFEQTLDKLIASKQSRQSKFSLFFLNINRFKSITDTLGYKTGDQIIKSFAEKLLKVIGKKDHIFRWGGDEFVILFPNNSSLKQLSQVASRIIEMMKESVVIDNEKFYLTTSIGVVVYPQDGNDSDTLIKNADVALCNATSQGKNKYYFYKPLLNSQNQDFLRLENDLYQAIEEKQFFIDYLPEINVKTQKIECFEALLRWRHPKKGVLMPNQFISLAEETGLMIPITEWVIDTVCAQNVIWQQQHATEIRIAVNISTNLFNNWNLTDTVIEYLDKYDLDPHLLELEITENTLIDNMQAVRENFIKLLKKGVKITMDDFGTGYSSLVNLKKIPFHYLKINQSFVQELHNNAQDRAIISSIITMARGFQMKVIAEGVENQKNFQLLTELGCDYIQGYLLSKPLATDQVIPFLVKF